LENVFEYMFLADWIKWCRRLLFAVKVRESCICCAKGAAVLYDVLTVLRVFVRDEIVNKRMDLKSRFRNFVSCDDCLSSVVFEWDDFDARGRISVFRKVSEFVNRILLKRFVSL